MFTNIFWTIDTQRTNYLISNNRLCVNMFEYVHSDDSFHFILILKDALSTSSVQFPNRKSLFSVWHMAQIYLYVSPIIFYTNVWLIFDFLHIWNIYLFYWQEDQNLHRNRQIREPLRHGGGSYFPGTRHKTNWMKQFVNELRIVKN